MKKVFLGLIFKTLHFACTAVKIERKVSSYCVSASPAQTKLAIRKCGGSLNLFLMSANLLPENCASTVSTMALKPARSARRTNFAIT